MREEKQESIPVVVDKNSQVVYAVPARAKQKPSWWYRNADGLLLIGLCFAMMIYIMVNP